MSNEPLGKYACHLMSPHKEKKTFQAIRKLQSWWAASRYHYFWMKCRIWRLYYSPHISRECHVKIPCFLVTLQIVTLPGRHRFQRGKGVVAQAHPIILNAYSLSEAWKITWTGSVIKQSEFKKDISTDLFIRTLLSTQNNSSVFFK